MVSFCALQLEIEDQLSNTAPDIEFNCNRTLEGLFRDLEISNPVARIKPCRPDPESCRGTRQMSKIIIETYSNFKAGMSEIKGEKEKSSSNCSKEASPSILHNLAGDLSELGASVSSSSRSSRKRVNSSSSKLSTKESTPISLSASNCSSNNEASCISLSSTKAREASRGQSIASSIDDPKDSIINFVSGNPFVEVTKGILHLYKENETTSLEEGILRSQMLCMIGVPAKHKTLDLLQFTASCHSELEMMRVIHDGSPNQYMVLLRFRCQESADEFYQAFNGTPYNFLEPEKCSLVYISKVETCKESEYYPYTNHTELPVCSICLERMDESVSTVLTILCNHSFHGSCLAQWEDTTCPVCRYVQSPDVVAEQRCSECSSADDLWICLICGYVGCGRYVGGHSHAHFLATEHSYTMELVQNQNVQRVWDYVGDNFVHRLMQTENFADGKLVESNGPQEECHTCNCKGATFGGNATENEKSNSGVDGVRVNVDEKIDSIQLEYTYLLTSQLESQRRYFEEKIARLEGDTHREIDEVMNRARSSVEESTQLKNQVSALLKEKTKSEKKLSELQSKLNKTSRQLEEEKHMNKSLCQNQNDWQTKVAKSQKEMEAKEAKKDKEIKELQEQVRDLMFYMEAQQKIAGSPLCQEIQDGDLVIAESSEATGSNGSRTTPKSGKTNLGAKSKRKGR